MPCIAYFDIMSLIDLLLLYYIYIYTIYICMYVYICVCVRARAELRYACFGIRCGFKPLGVSFRLGKLGEFRTPGWSKQTTTDFRVGDWR
jgi:hypothetical protein